MKGNKVLILGDGLLGTELVKQTGWDMVSRKNDDFDITNTETYHNLLKVEWGVVQYSPYDVIINCVADTDTYSEKKENHWKVNYEGVSNLVDFCNKWKITLVHISTDSVYANSKTGATELDVPVHAANWYSYTKLLGDSHIQLKSNDYLLLRGTHKETPFKHEMAWITQIGNFDYIDIITNIIISLIRKEARGMYNIGTEPKTMYELAKRTNPNVSPAYELFHETTAANVIISIEKMKRKLEDKN